MPQCPVASEESGGGWGTTFGDPNQATTMLRNFSLHNM